MNNKGFTLIELLSVITLISFITIFLFIFAGDTLSITSDKAYEIFHKNIIIQTKNYILECDNKLINCDNDYVWDYSGDMKKTSFYLDVLKKYNYFQNEEFIDPISKKDVSACLLIEVSKDDLSNIIVNVNNKKC